MNTPSRPSLKSITPTPTTPVAAGPAVPHLAVGEPEGAARKGVLSFLRSDSRPVYRGRHASEDPTPDRPGIRISAPPVYRDHYDGARWSTRYAVPPTAAYACSCGQTGTARGRGSVAALVAKYETHKATCTGAPAPHTEGRAAA